jgi:thiol-disulfide isomerase/thioredoxin
MRCILLSICLAAFAPVHSAVALDLADFRGRVVYLDFWASWCGPCRQSFPWMETLQSTYQGRGLAIVAVNLDRDRADADKFLKQFHPTFEVRFDPKGELAELYKVQGMPSSVLIDRHGVMRFTHVGFRPVAASSCTEAGLLSTVAMLHGAGAQAYLEEQGVRHWVLD